MNFPAPPGAGAGVGAGTGLPKFDPNDPNMKWMSRMMESCFAKSTMSGVMGFGLGGLFGMFMASLSYDTMYHYPSTVPARPGLPNPSGTPTIPISSLPLRQQLHLGLRDMGTRSWSTAKNFGRVGALYSGIECGFEGLRARSDYANPTAAGCLTGAILARHNGPLAAAGGCAGFAAFSAAIEVWLRMPKEEED